MPLRYAALASALLLLTAAGCVSAKGAYTNGMARETAGDYGAAARDYIKALERDPSIRNVAGRLAVAGRQAVRQHITQAGAAPPDQAADHYLAADELVVRAARLGVELERPSAFDQNRDAALDGGVAFLTEEAQTARASGDFAGALDRLQRTASLRPSADRQRDAAALALAVYGDWAEADLAAGFYRDGLGHVEQALAQSPTYDALLDLRDAILDAGTVVAAVLPAEGREVPRAFLRDLTDVLVDERLAAPPDFVALVDPADVRRWDRRSRRGDLADQPRQLAEAARDLGADLGIVVSVAPIREQEVAGDVQTRTARVRSERVSYSTREITLTVSAEADLVTVQADSRRPVCERSVSASVTERYQVATADRDWRDFDLSRAERAAFASDAARQAYDRALAALRDRLATALAGCVQAQVP